MKRRKDQIIPEPLPSCELEGAILHRESRPHRCLVAFPARPGPQPCVVQVIEPGRPIFYWRLVVLPDDAPRHRESENDTIGTMLSLISHYAEKQIRAANEDDDVKLWSTTLWDEPPFRTLDHTEYFKQAFDLLKELKKLGTAGSDKLQGLIKEFSANTTRLEKRWSPLVIPTPNDDAMRENFEIISRWPDWDDEGLTLTQRIPWIAKICGKTHPHNFAAFKKLEGTFKKRLQFLRLKCTGRSKRGQRHADIEQILRETNS